MPVWCMNASLCMNIEGVRFRGEREYRVEKPWEDMVPNNLVDDNTNKYHRIDTFDYTVTETANLIYIEPKDTRAYLVEGKLVNNAEA